MRLSSLILRLERLVALTGQNGTTPPGVPSPAVSEPAAEVEPASPAPARPEDSAASSSPAEPVPDSIFLPEAAAAAEPESPVSADRVVDLTAREAASPFLSLNRWSDAVAASNDACFVLDHNGMVLSVSAAAVELLGVGNGMIIGRHILEAVTLVDLESGAPNPDYAPRITALVVLEGPGLARSIMRVRRQDHSITTLDSSSAPIHDATGDLLGSVTFLGRIPA